MQTKELGKALNQKSQDEPLGSLALNFSNNYEDNLPDWIMLLPAGPEIKGRDGRAWRLEDPATILAAFHANNADLPLDIGHSSELLAPKGEPAPAVAWIKELEVRDGAVWGRVEWNSDGRWVVGDKQYRYISPVFLYNKKTMEIFQLTSVGLINQPNLLLPALNREGQQQQKQEVNMDLLKMLLAALGMAETETPEAALNTVGKLKGDLEVALNRAFVPDLTKFVPRGDYDTAVNRATAAEQALATSKKAAHTEEIDIAINAALAAGKIAPASKDFYVASCQAEGGLAAFNTFIESAPVVAEPSNLDNEDPNKGKGSAMNADQTKIANQFGNSAEDLKKYGTDDQA